MMLPLVSAIEECSRLDQNPKKIPCTVVSSFLPDSGCDSTVSIYLTNGTSNSTFIQDLTWEESVPFCQFIWNISTPTGTYIYNSSIEDGMVTLQREDNMLAIVIMFVFMAGMFIFIGAKQPQGAVKFITYGLALLEILIMLWVVWYNETGGDITNLLWTNTIICLTLGGFFGILSLFWQTTKFIPIGDKTQFAEDNWAKWQKRN